MANSELSIIVRVKDEATSAMKGIGGALSSATGASTAFAAGLAGIGAGVAAFGYKSVMAAQESVNAQHQLAAVLKSTGNAAGLYAEDLNDQAAALAKTTNFTDDSITSAQSLLLTFTNIKGATFQRATDSMVDLAAAMGTDASGSAIQLGKALNDPTQGISALSRVGVSFTEDQKKVIQKMQETGDMAGAQKVILDELSKEFGGSAAATIDPFVHLKNSIGEAFEAIGMQLLPEVTKLATKIEDFVNNNLQGWIDKTKEIIGWFMQHKEALVIIGGVILGALVPAIYAAAVAFGTLFISLAPFMLAGAAVAGIVLGILWIVKHWDLIWAKVQEVWGAITAYLAGVWTSISTAISTAWGAIAGVFTTVFDAITNVIKFAIAFEVGLIIGAFRLMGIDIVGVFQGIYQFFVSIWNSISAFFTSAMSYIGTAWNTFWTQTKDTLAAIWGIVAGVIKSGWDSITGVFNAAIAPLKSAWDNMWGQMSGSIGGIWEGIKGVVASGLNWVIDKINRVISAANRVADMGSQLGINAPHIPSIPRLATGGIVTSPTLAMIGEGREPEAVIPLSKLGGMVGGTGGGIFINFYGDINSGESFVEEMADKLARQIKLRVRV